MTGNWCSVRSRLPCRANSHADEAEDRDDHQQQRIDRREAVPTERDHVEIGVVVAELPHDCVYSVTPATRLRRCQPSRRSTVV